MADIVFVTNEDDWQGVYVDGELVTDGHTINYSALFDRLVGETISSTKWRVVDEDWMQEEGYLPSNLFDVKFKNNA